MYFFQIRFIFGRFWRSIGCH